MVDADTLRPTTHRTADSPRVEDTACVYKRSESERRLIEAARRCDQGAEREAPIATGERRSGHKKGSPGSSCTGGVVIRTWRWLCSCVFWGREEGALLDLYRARKQGQYGRLYSVIYLIPKKCLFLLP